MTFKLRSGNKTPFKMMGSSPVKQDEVKKLDATLDQIDRARLHTATLKDNATSSTTGSRSTAATVGTMKKANENRSNRDAGKIYPAMGNTTVPVTTNTTSSPSYLDPVTRKSIDTKDVSIKNRQNNFDEFLEENPNYDNVVHEKDGSTDSRSRTFDAENNILSTTSTTTRGFIAPKVDMPTISLKQITPKIPKPEPEKPKKAKFPKDKVEVKRKKVKRVKRPKGTKTRNLVTGGKNRTRRSTGTSKRR